MPARRVADLFDTRDAAHRRVRGDVQGGAEAVARAMGAAPGGHARRASRSSRAATASTSSRTRSRRCRDAVGDAEFERLAQALSLVFGVEVLIVLKDIWGLDGEARSLWRNGRPARSSMPRGEDAAKRSSEAGLGYATGSTSLWPSSWRLVECDRDANVWHCFGATRRKQMKLKRFHGELYRIGAVRSNRPRKRLTELARLVIPD